MRVSSGFFVTGLSGKMRIQTLPPRLMQRVMAICERTGLPFRMVPRLSDVLEGQARTLIGLNGEVVVDNQAGDFLFIPAGVWHQPMNVSNRPVVAIEARADADDQSNVILAPNQP